MRSSQALLRREPSEADARVRTRRLESRLDETERELATARPSYATLRSRKAIPTALAVADFIRHPRRARSR